MAYNKSKNVEAAQKLLNQGKIAQAIAEYQQILKFEPKDQVTLMTVGELYIRQGETFQAIDYFERLAQIFVGDGFLTKAIAVYKRIAKLAPEEIRPLERLAELYVQQGVMSEARPLFLQLAEIHLKNNRQAEAVALLKKLLMAEPDNMRIQVRLADLYQAMGQTKEAVEAYVDSAERAMARGEQQECERLAEKALKLDPKHLAAMTVKARAHAGQGQTAQAIQLLEHMPGLDKGGEQAEFLLDLYLKGGKLDEASALGLRVFENDEKNFGLAQKAAEGLMESGETDRAMALIERLRGPMIDGGEHEVISRLLTELAARMPGRLEPHEWLVDMFGRTSDSFRMPDALAHLGDAAVAAGKLERAKEVFEQLVDREPDSESARRKLNDVLRKMGLLAGEPEPAPIAAEPLEVNLPKAPESKFRAVPEPPGEVHAEKTAESAQEAPLDEETQRFIAQSLTDVDLFASYGLTQKAIGLLDAILRRAPQHTPTLEKLLDFSLGAGEDRRTAELAAQLEQIHREQGDARNAERFSELRRRFQRAAGLTDADMAAATTATEAAPVAAEVPATVAEASAPTPAKPEPEPVPAAAQPPAPPETAPAVHEVDLSDEWTALLEEAAPLAAKKETHAPSPAPAAPEKIPEFVVESAVEAHAESAETSEGHEGAIVPPPEAPALAEFAVEAEVASAEEAQAPAELPPVPDVKTTRAPAAHKTPKKHGPPPPPPESEFELEQDYELVLEPEAVLPAHEQPGAVSAKPPLHEPAKQEQPAAALSSDDFLADLAREIDELGLGELAPENPKAAEAKPPAIPRRSAKPAEPVPAAPEAAVPADLLENAPLREVFEEFRAELGEMGTEDEDLETHYNLGTAFREMGLVDEAISEFQKVAKATDSGRPFPYTMQCATLLGLAFMEKGQPGIAALWYERALLTPGGMNPESSLALRYDLGVAQEAAGENDAALKSFSRVYALNIDYRDVAERIAALEKTAR